MKKVNEYKLLSNHDYFKKDNGKLIPIHVDKVTEEKSIWLPFIGRRTKKVAHYSVNGKKFKIDAKNKFYE